MNRHRPCCIVAVVDTDNTPEITLGLAAVELKAKIALTVAFPEGPAERSFKVIKKRNWPHTHTHACHLHTRPYVVNNRLNLPLMSSHWDLLPAELKAKIALTVAFPEGDFLVLQSQTGRFYWSELRYRGRVFDLETGREIDDRQLALIPAPVSFGFQ